ncbi:MAG: HlyC/CorC family transporter [Opitutales bacterium]|nr:HlyC/CorC family transporter [Opitutales bacterium]
MITLVLSVAFTLGVSGFCSLLEAFVLSLSTAEIEDFRQQHPRLGTRLDLYKKTINQTSSAILTLNTMANTAGASLVGAIASDLFQSIHIGIISGILTLAILVFSEIIPKNLGVAYRRTLCFYLVCPLTLVRVVMWPFSFVAHLAVKPFLPRRQIVDEDEREILLLAEKSAKEGSLSTVERDMISNTLSLDDVLLTDILTPRTVVTFLDGSLTVEEVMRDFKLIPFARIPVYRESIDDIIGMVRRRDIMQAYSENKPETTIESLMVEIAYIPETASGDDALQLFLKKHTQLALVVDEFGSTAGVITMEDVMEHILGREIYDETDVAIDMRDLARRKAQRLSRSRKNIPSDIPPPQ